MKQIQPASKPDQLGLSSSIGLEVIYVRTQVVFQRHVGTPAAAAATAAAVTELPRVSPGIFPFNWSVFRRLEPRKLLPGGQYRKNGPSHHPNMH